MGHTLDLDFFVVHESVVLTRDPRMVNHGPRIGRQTTHGCTKVRVNLHDFFNRAALQQRGLDTLLDTEHGTLPRCDTDRRRSQLDSLQCVLDLEQTTLRRKGIHTTIILGPRKKHGASSSSSSSNRRTWVNLR